MTDKIKEKQSTSRTSLTADTEASEIEFDTPKDLPYGAEYAKSNRASCKGCKESIAKDTLRMSVRFQSRFFDGMQDNWHHFECFWKKARKNDINEASIRGMELLKWDDQERIRQRIDELKASEDGGYTPKAAAIKVEHAKSGTGKCFLCKKPIQKGELRISKTSFYHVECFHSLKIFQKSAEELTGYAQLDDNDKQRLNELFPKPQTEKKRKQEDSTEMGTPIKRVKDDEATRKSLKNQSDILWKTHEDLRENLNLDEMELISEANGSFRPKKHIMERMLNKLTDWVVFGVPSTCPECNGQLNYSTDNHTYKCTGSISEYTRCMYQNRNPKRTPMKIPKTLKKENEFVKGLKSPLLTERLYPAAAISEKVIEKPKTFQNLNYAARNENSSTKKGSAVSGSQRMVSKRGLVVDPKCTVADTTHVYVDKETQKPWEVTLSMMDISSGKNSFYKLQIVKSDDKSRFYLFRSWGRIGTDIGGSTTTEYGSDFEACATEFKKLFEDKTHNSWDAYVENKFVKRTNGFSILDVDFGEPEKRKKKLEKLDVEQSKSQLPRAVKELIAMVFDVNAFNDTLKEFEIDMDKMPLGRLSRSQILRAYEVLADLQRVLEVGRDRNVEKPAKHVFVDFTNRFYTLVPHATGTKSPPMLDNLDILKKKTEMLDNLLEIEIAYNILKQEGEEMEAAGGKRAKDEFDLHYEKLGCKIEVLEQSSSEFALIKRYVENTHAPTHEIRLDIVNILKVEREVETKRFMRDVGNVHLLWHGSRLSNYAGILSQGLRIAPPEAPVTGYMFGKGIYTADMVTKSANYCYATTGEGLLLLCEVALGKMQELRDAQDIKKPKKGMDSVKGVGGTYPDPKEAEHLESTIVPCGKSIKSNEKNLSLLYNEYIVYSEKQIRMRYVVRVKFSSNLL